MERYAGFFFFPVTQERSRTGTDPPLKGYSWLNTSWDEICLLCASGEIWLQPCVPTSTTDGLARCGKAGGAGFYRPFPRLREKEVPASKGWMSRFGGLQERQRPRFFSFLPIKQTKCQGPVMFQDFFSWINGLVFMFRKMGYKVPNNPLSPLKEW